MSIFVHTEQWRIRLRPKSLQYSVVFRMVLRRGVFMEMSHGMYPVVYLSVCRLEYEAHAPICLGLRSSSHRIEISYGAFDLIENGQGVRGG